MAGSAAEERLRVLAAAALRRARPAARIVHELNTNGTGSIRLDLAAVDLDHLVMVEIKSEKDKLTRLKAQLEAAHRAANSVWLVITIKHAPELIRMSGYGAGQGYQTDYDLFTLLSRTKVLIENTAGELQILDHRGRMGGADLFPHARDQWRMLWANEMRAELAPWGFNSSMTPMTRFAIDNMTGREVRQAVCRQLRSRGFARADAPLSAAPEKPAAVAEPCLDLGPARRDVAAGP